MAKDKGERPAETGKIDASDATDDPGKPIKISTADVDSAAAFWARHCPPEFKGLMSAKADDETSDQDE